MKKAFLIGLLFLNLSAYAQKNKIEIGFQGGINLNSEYEDSHDVPAKGSTTGLSIGGNVKWNKTEKFGIRLQLSYDQMGWAYRGLVFESGLFTDSKTDVLYKLRYINLPVLAEYTSGKKIKWNVGAGFFTGCLLKSTIVQKNYPPLVAGQLETYEGDNDNIRRLNFGFTAGAGLQLPLSSKISIRINAMNYTGLIGISKPLFDHNSYYKTLTFSFSSGLSFQL